MYALRSHGITIDTHKEKQLEEERSQASSIGTIKNIIYTQRKFTDHDFSDFLSQNVGEIPVNFRENS